MKQVDAQLDAQIVVLDHLLNTLRGLRLSPDVIVAQAAIKREREIAAEYNRLRAQSDSRQPELIPHSQAA